LAAGLKGFGEKGDPRTWKIDVDKGSLETPAGPFKLDN
jgi:hypothetical protein